MIPKILHYCWYGSNMMPKNQQRYIKQWKQLMPDYEIRYWNNSNLPNDISYINTAFKAGNWANVSNYMRLYALLNEGGIYLDTDVEVLKPFDDLRQYPCFLGIEDEERLIVNNAIMGAEKGHWFVQETLNMLEQKFDGKEKADYSSPLLVTEMLKQYGFSKNNLDIIDIKIFSCVYFYPYYYTQSAYSASITPQTYAIHHWHMSWSGKPAWQVKWERVKLDIKWVLKKVRLLKFTERYFMSSHEEKQKSD